MEDIGSVLSECIPALWDKYAVVEEAIGIAGKAQRPIAFLLERYV